jgi:hypothetical protein
MSLSDTSQDPLTVGATVAVHAAWLASAISPNLHTPACCIATQPTGQPESLLDRAVDPSLRLWDAYGVLPLCDSKRRKFFHTTSRR